MSAAALGFGRGLLRMSDTYSPDVAQQIPAGGNPNAPASGSYGEDAAVQRLEAALPNVDPMQQGEVAPLPVGEGGPQPQLGPPPGIPKGLLAPSRQPDVPVGSPLSQPQLFVGGGRERRIALAESLVANPEMSEETKEIAQRYLNWVRQVR